MKINGKCKHLSYIAPLCLLWIFSPNAQAKNALNCTIFDESDKPAGKQEFILTTPAGKQIGKKKTNDQGEVKFTGLDDGSYLLSSEASVPATYEVSGNTEKPCKYTAVSVNTANSKMKEVMDLVQGRKYAEAEEKAKKVVEMMPNLADSHFYLALAYAYAGKEEAVAEVNKAKDMNPDKFKDKVTPIQMQVLNQGAEAAKLKGDFPGAIKKYEAMSALAPNDPIAYYNMAVTYGRAGNYDLAIKSIDKAIQLKPDDPESQKLKIQLQDAYLKQMDKKLTK